MRTLAFALSLSLASGITIVQAATPEHDMSRHPMAMQPAASHEGVGILKTVNVTSGKIQIAHEAIPALGWPPMTMWFSVQGPLPGNLKTGDAVRFEMMEDAKKQWVIIKLMRK